MRILAAFMAAAALMASAVSAQNVFPLASLSISNLALSPSFDPSVAPGVLAAGQDGTLQVFPSFSSYNQRSLRYARQITATSPVELSINFAASASTTLPLVVRVRNCASTLSTPSATQPSHCPFAAATAITLTSTASVAFPASNVWGPTFFELLTTGIVNGIATTIPYIVHIAVLPNPEGTNMLSLDTDFLGSSFDKPYTMQTSQYQINYTVQTTGSTFDVPFYLATQQSVSEVFVQECRRPCTACDINAIGERRSLTTPATSAPLLSPYAVEGQFVASVFPKHGRYTFTADIGSNCVRFINRILNGGGDNDYTITIALNVFNCGRFLTCSECSAQLSCGWCLTSNFNANAGSCRVGRVRALTGSTCIQQPGILLDRYIINPNQCTVVIKGDPRISGLQGQDFQVHGTPNEYFNLVSTASLQVNSRFVYLDDAQCDNFTTCFSHPGTYIDEIGVMMADNKVRLVAGGLKEAARVFINGKEVKVSAHKHTAGKITVTFANQRRVVIKTPEFMMTVSQSDKFFNVESALLKTELLDQGSKLLKLESSRAAEANTFMHGLIGQTWRNNVYAGGREYEGEVSDYQVADGLWGKDFAFNLYKL